MDETQDETDTAQATPRKYNSMHIKETSAIWEDRQQAGANEMADHCAHG